MGTHVRSSAPRTRSRARYSTWAAARLLRRLPGWKLINMFHGGKTPLLPVSQLEQMGFNIVIIPSDLQRAGIKAMQRSLEAIKRDGSSKSVLGDMAEFDERESLVATAEFLERGKRYAS